MIDTLLDKARALGASLAGIAPLDETVRARIELPDEVDPSHTFNWVLVLALAHGEDRPELDWWGGPGGTEGNRRLQEMSAELQRALAEEQGIRSHVLPYHPWRGGILLKNAAALAGLGVIGANNLLITPEYGPRVRLKAMLLADLGTSARETGFRQPSVGSKNPVSNPCDGCPRPCWQACPQDAFASGAYDRSRCAVQMEQDEARAPVHHDNQPGVSARARIAYCRACELACPAGR
jgi:epoxyqueuosine reductase